MTITLPKSILVFQPLVRQGGYRQRGAMAGIYHLAVGFHGPYFTISSLCGKSSVVELEQGYWFNVTYDELVRYEKEAFNNKVICKKCREALL
jgi:hypothetical protein